MLTSRKTTIGDKFYFDKNVMWLCVINTQSMYVAINQEVDC